MYVCARASAYVHVRVRALNSIREQEVEQEAQEKSGEKGKKEERRRAAREGMWSGIWVWISVLEGRAQVDR